MCMHARKTIDMGLGIVTACGVEYHLHMHPAMPLSPTSDLATLSPSLFVCVHAGDGGVVIYNTCSDDADQRLRCIAGRWTDR
jgi:hypothetical protein